MLREAYSEKWEKSYLAFPEPESVNELILWRGNYSGDHQDPLDQEKNVIHGDHSDQYQYCIKFFQILWYWNKTHFKPQEKARKLRKVFDI